MSFLRLRAEHVGQAADGERYDASAVEIEQPADRAAEYQFALAILEQGVPVHLLRERQIAEDVAEQLRQRVDGALATDVAARGDVLSLVGFDPLE